MRIAVDLSKCDGYANCVMAAPDVFDLGDDGLVVVLEPVLPDPEVPDPLSRPLVR